MKKCTNCRSGFRIYPETEHYCGFCGACLTSADITPKDELFFMYIDEDQEYELEYEIVNTGLVSLDISQPKLMD